MAAGVSVTFESQLGSAVANVAQLTRALKDAKDSVKSLTAETGSGSKKMEDALKAKAEAAKAAKAQLDAMKSVVVNYLGPAAAAAAAIKLINSYLGDQAERSKAAGEALRGYVQSDGFKQLIAAAGGSAANKRQIEATAATLSQRAGLTNERAVAIASKAALEGQTPGDALAAAQLEKVSPGVNAENVIDIAGKFGVGAARFGDVARGLQEQAGGTTAAELMRRMDRLAPFAKEAGVGFEDVAKALAIARDKGDVRGSTAAMQTVLDAIGQRVATGQQRGGLGLEEALATFATTAPDEFRKRLEESAQFRQGFEYTIAAGRMGPTPSGQVARDAALRSASREGVQDRLVAAEAEKERAERQRAADELRFQTVQAEVSAELEGQPIRQTLVGWQGWAERLMLGPAAAAERVLNPSLLRGAAPSEQVQNPGALLDDATYERLRQQARREVLTGPGQTSLSDITPDWAIPRGTQDQIDKRLTELIEALKANTGATRTNTGAAGGAAPRSLRDHRGDDFEGRGVARVGALVAGLMRGL